MLNIVYQHKNSRKKRLDFEGRVCNIGSGKQNNFLIFHKNVSKEHARITYSNSGECILEDLSGKNQIWINRVKISEKAHISDSDEIIIGDIRLWVCLINNDDVDHTFHETPKAVNKPLPFYETDKHEQLPNSSLSEKEALSEQKPNTKVNEQLLYWGNIIHAKMIEQLDLRRKDVHRMSDSELRSETQTLIDDIISGLGQSIPLTIDINTLKNNVLNEAVGLGPLEKFLEDNSITEIMVNNHSEIFVERKGQLQQSEHCFTGDNAVLSVIERIITPIGRRIDESSPMVDARLKDGSRVNAIIPPLALKGPSLTIRKFAKRKLAFTDLITSNSINPQMVEFLRLCVVSRKNIIVSGGTGSGKTTLLNILSNFIPKDERIVTVEDAAELQLNQPNLVSLEAKPANVEGKGLVSIRDLVRNTLRMRPDRIVVGECRGGEALDMLQAMNTGHDGSLTTAHANSPRDVLSRLEVMVLMAGMDLPISAIREQVASAIDVIVQQTRFPCGSRKITKITEVVGVESGTIQLQDIFEYKQYGFDANDKVHGQFSSMGFVPNFYEDLKRIGLNPDISIFKPSKEEIKNERY